MSYDNVQVKAQAVKRALPASIDDLERVAQNLEGTLSTLRSQLSPILDAPTTLRDAGIGDGTCPQHPHYTSRINDVISQIKEMNETLHDIIGRLHV